MCQWSPIDGSHLFPADDVSVFVATARSPIATQRLEIETSGVARADQRGEQSDHDDDHQNLYECESALVHENAFVLMP